MEEVIQLIVNNGLGIASFGALLYFMDKYLSKISESVNEISHTQSLIQENLTKLSTRVDDIEKVVNKKKG